MNVDTQRFHHCNLFSCGKHCFSRRPLIAILPDIDRLLSSMGRNRTDKIDEDGSWVRTRYSWPLSVFTVGGLGLELCTHLLLNGRKWRIKVLEQVFGILPCREDEGLVHATLGCSSSTLPLIRFQISFDVGIANEPLDSNKDDVGMTSFGAPLPPKIRFD